MPFPYMKNAWSFKNTKIKIGGIMNFIPPILL